MDGLQIHTIYFPGEDWMSIFAGQEKSACTTPCKTFHTKTKFLSGVKEKQDKFFRLRLFFIPNMIFLQFFSFIHCFYLLYFFI